MKNVNILKFANKRKTLLILILMFILPALSVPHFFTSYNIINLLVQVSLNGVIACGMTFALIAAEFDLSVGSVMACSGIIMVLLIPELGFFGGVAAALLASALMGLINGLLVSKARINSFIATLGTMTLYKGIAMKLSDGKPIHTDNPIVVALGEYKLFGIPIYPIVFLLICMIGVYVLNRTRFGRNVFATGGNKEVTKNSGINVSFYKTMVFVIVCITSGVAGVLLVFRLNAASAITGDSTSLLVISGIIVGGTSTAGGDGSMSRSIIGMFILAIIANALDLAGIYSYYQMAVTGALTVVIIGTASYFNYRKVRSL